MLILIVSDKNGLELEKIKINIPKSEYSDLVDSIIQDWDIHCCDGCDTYFRFDDLEDSGDEECNFYCQKCFRKTKGE